MVHTISNRQSKLNIVLWIIQILLGLLFLWAGIVKFMLDIDELQGAAVKFPWWFLRFIGVTEILGGLGLILPGMLRVQPILTPLAALGLLLIMIGATAVGVMNGPLAYASVPALCALLAGVIAYSRWRVLPHRARS